MSTDTKVVAIGLMKIKTKKLTKMMLKQNNENDDGLWYMLMHDDCLLSIHSTEELAMHFGHLFAMNLAKEKMKEEMGKTDNNEFEELKVEEGQLH